MTHFADRLEAAIEDQGAPICVGIDPHLELIPRSFFEETLPSYENGEDGLCEVAASFCFELLDVLAEAGVRVVKPQVAFFEALGASGMEAYQSICMAAKTHEMVVIADVKRGDIGSTSAAYSRGWIGGSSCHGARCRPFACDAITVNPYLGSDGIKPFVTDAQANGRGLFILLRTSNPSSSEIQEKRLLDGRMVYEHVADLIRDWGSEGLSEGGLSMVGAVVGATQPEAAAALRERMPETVFLVPGYGAQGAGADELKPFFLKGGRGAIVNSSRGVIHAYREENANADWKHTVQAAAQSFLKDVGSVALSV